MRHGQTNGELFLVCIHISPRVMYQAIMTSQIPRDMKKG